METRIHVRHGEETPIDRGRNGNGLSVLRRCGGPSAQSREFSPSTTLFLQGDPSLEVFYQLTALKYLSARQRFERFLLQFLSSIQLHEQQTSIKIRLPLKRWEIAQLIGIRPEHLSRILQQIKREGLLHEEDGYMIVSDVRKIRVHDECG